MKIFTVSVEPTNDGEGHPVIRTTISGENFGTYIRYTNYTSNFRVLGQDLLKEIRIVLTTIPDDALDNLAYQLKQLIEKT